MIWFACPKCKQAHGRPENSSGSMVFCPCGQGLTVPWESTIAEPANVPVVVVPPAGRAQPLSFGGPSKPEPIAPLPPARAARRRGRVEPDPKVCLNHESRPKQKTCADCGLSFCDDCVVTFRGQDLCGPCKNYEAKLLQRPPKVSFLALTSVLAAFLAVVLVVGAPSGRGTVFTVLMVIALAVQTLSFLMGLFALRLLQADRRIGGRGLAITGMATASFTALLTIAITVVNLRAGI